MTATRIASLIGLIQHIFKRRFDDRAWARMAKQQLRAAWEDEGEDDELYDYL